MRPFFLLAAVLFYLTPAFAQDHLAPGQAHLDYSVGAMIDRQADAYVVANAALFLSLSYAVGVKRSGENWRLAGGTEYLASEGGGGIRHDTCHTAISGETGDKILQLWKKALSHVASDTDKITVLDGTSYTFATREQAGTVLSPSSQRPKMKALVAVSLAMLDVCRSGKRLLELEQKIDQLLPLF